MFVPLTSRTIIFYFYLLAVYCQAKCRNQALLPDLDSTSVICIGHVLHSYHAYDKYIFFSLFSALVFGDSLV